MSLSLFDSGAAPGDARPIGTVANDVRFTVFGVAAPQGSKKAFAIKSAAGKYRAVVVNDNKPRLNDWRDAVRQRAQELADQDVFFGQGTPIALTVVFYLPRPKSAPKKVRYPTTKPDSMKLVRAVEDAMTNVLYHDDAQIVGHDVRKCYAIDSPPRAEIALRVFAE